LETKKLNYSFKKILLKYHGNLLLLIMWPNAQVLLLIRKHEWNISKEELKKFLFLHQQKISYLHLFMGLTIKNIQLIWKLFLMLL